MENEFDKDYEEHYGENERQSAVDDFFSKTSAPEVQQEATTTEPTRSLRERVTFDITSGLSQAPRSVARGAISGVNEFIETLSDLTPTATFLTEEGKMSYPRVVSVSESGRRQQKAVERKGGTAPSPVPQIPQLSEPLYNSNTGKIIETISQFMTGFGAAGKGLKAAGVAAKGVKGAVAKGTIADLLSFDEKDDRLSNALDGIPELKDSWLTYLKAEPDDSFAEGKFKQAVEGSVIGGASEFVFKGLSAYKKFRAASKKATESGVTPDDVISENELISSQKITTEDFSMIGDINDPNLIIKKFHKKSDVVEGGVEQIQTTQAKLTKAEKEVSGVPNPKQGAKQLGVEQEISINFARIQGDEDVKKLMQEMANDPRLISSVQKARRGKQSTQATLNKAEDVDGFDELMTRRTGEAFNDVQIVAARKVYYDTTAKLLEVAERAASPQANSLDQYAFRQMLAVHHAVQKEMLGVKAEAGRALRAWAIPLGGSDGEKIKSIQKMLDGYGGAEASKELASKMAAMAKTGGLSSSQINAISRGGAFARTNKALEEIWRMGLLTSLRTHNVNISSNFLTGLTLAAERYTTSLVSKEDKMKVEAVNFFAGYIKSFKLALINAKEALRTGNTGKAFDKIELPPIRASSREVLDPEGKMGIFSKAIDSYGNLLNRTVGAGLAAGDEFGKTLLYQAELHASAAREASANGLSGKEAKQFIADFVSNPPETTKMSAEDFAKYGTYNSELSGTALQFQKFINNTPGARFVIPFVRTPINIFSFTFSRTPLGMLSQKIRDDIAAGGVKRSKALAKMGTGTSMMMLGVDSALNGSVTGGGPTDPDIRNQLMNTGWKPYSIKIGDKFYSYARWEPFATWLGMSADLTEILSNYEAYDIEMQREVENTAVAVVASISNQVVGKSFMSGIADTTSVLADPKRYGQQFLNRYAGSIVPNIFGDIERAINPEIEQAFNMLDAFKARIPGLSSQVPSKYNVYGEKIKAYYPSEDNVALAFTERAIQLVNPVAYSDLDQPPQPVDEFFLKNGLDGIGMPDKVQRFPAEGLFGQKRNIPINLREYPKIYERFLQLRGETRLPKYFNMTMKQYLNGLISGKVPGSIEFHSPLIKGTDNQQLIIEGIQRDYDAAIRKELMNEFGVLRQAVIEEQRKNEELDMRRVKTQ